MVSSTTSSYGGLGVIGIKTENSFYDKENAKLITDNEYGKTTKEMMSQETFAGFDFENVWKIEEGKSYPTLRWLNDTTNPEPQLKLEGDGTKNNPYQLKKAKDFDEIRKAMNANYIVVNDIDFTGVNIEPIGTVSERYANEDEEAFSGSLDGNNYTISNFYQEREDFEQTHALFLYTNGAEVKNIIFKNVKTRPEQFYETRMSSYEKPDDNTRMNKYGAKSYLEEHANFVPVVALFGIVRNSTLKNITVTDVDLMHNWRLVGGLVGYANNSIIERCAVLSGEATAMETSSAASLIGAATNTLVKECYTSMNLITNNSLPAGMIGISYGGVVVENSYAADTITSYGQYANTINSIIGYSDESDTIKNCYSTSTLEEYDSKITINFKLAPDGANIINSYYLGEKTSAELMKKSTFKDWDFGNVWQIDEGKSYPTLRNINNPVDFLNNTYSLAWPTESGEITLWYGPVDHLYKKFHEGIDIQSRDPSKKRVYSATNGVVTEIKRDTLYGDIVYINFIFDNKCMQIRYAHLSDTSHLDIGKKVAMNGYLGEMSFGEVAYLLEMKMYEFDDNNFDSTNKKLVNPSEYFDVKYEDIDYLSQIFETSIDTNLTSTLFSQTDKNDSNSRYKNNKDINKNQEVYLRKMINTCLYWIIGETSFDNEKSLEKYLKYDSINGIATVNLNNKTKKYYLSQSIVRNDRIVVNKNEFLEFFFGIEIEGQIKYKKPAPHLPTEKTDNPEKYEVSFYLWQKKYDDKNFLKKVDTNMSGKFKTSFIPSLSKHIPTNNLFLNIETKTADSKFTNNAINISPTELLKNTTYVWQVDLVPYSEENELQVLDFTMTFKNTNK